MPKTAQGEIKPLFTNQMYDRLKWVVVVFLPAFASLYFGMAQILELPEPEKVVGSIALLTTFLGTLLKISDKSYNASDAKFDGALIYTPSEEKDIYSFEVGNLDELHDKEVLTIKVDKKGESRRVQGL